MTIDLALKLAPIILSVLTIIVGALVYRLSAEKLFHDMRVPRFEAHTAFLEALISARQKLNDIRADPNRERDRDQIWSQEVWNTAGTAALLFGDEVKIAIYDLEHKYNELAIAHDNLIDAHLHGEDAKSERAEVRRLSGELMAKVSHYKELSRPYIDAGRRGLSLSQRARVRFPRKKLIR